MMPTFSGVRKIFGWLEAAVFEVGLRDGRTVHMHASLPHEGDYFVVVLVDADRFLRLWRQPVSSHPSVAHQDPETWPSDYKYKYAVEGYSFGLDNPVPLAQVSCRRSPCNVLGNRRSFFFLRTRAVLAHAGDPCLTFINGITRTIYLLSNGAKCFPILCESRSADLLVELAGWESVAPLVLSSLRESRIIYD